MFAVIVDGGRQYRVEKGTEFLVDYREAANPGDALRFEQVLLAGTKGSSTIGKPLVDGAVVEAEVVAHKKGPKLDIGKFTRRKNSRRHRGHRQNYTAIRITALNIPGLAEEAAPAAETPAT
jgi:large subunit ribosomal protein L21